MLLFCYSPTGTSAILSILDSAILPCSIPAGHVFCILISDLSANLKTPLNRLNDDDPRGERLSDLLPGVVEISTVVQL